MVGSEVWKLIVSPGFSSFGWRGRPLSLNVTTEITALDAPKGNSTFAEYCTTVRNAREQGMERQTYVRDSSRIVRELFSGELGNDRDPAFVEVLVNILGQPPYVQQDVCPPTYGVRAHGYRILECSSLGFTTKKRDKLPEVHRLLILDTERKDVAAFTTGATFREPTCVLVTGPAEVAYAFAAGGGEKYPTGSGLGDGGWREPGRAW